MIEAPGRQDVARHTVDLSIVSPVYGNKETLPELYRRLSAILNSLGICYEIAFVNDACPHGSQPVLEELAARDSCIRVVTLPENVGQHRTVIAGLSQCQGRKAIVLDADLQDPPEAIPQLIESLDNGKDAVFATREGKYQSRARHATSFTFKFLIHILARVPMGAGMFFALSEKGINKICAFPTSHPYVVSMIGLSGLRVGAVPIKRAPRPAGRSATNWRRRFTIGGSAILWTAIWRLRPSIQKEPGDSCAESASAT